MSSVHRTLSLAKPDPAAGTGDASQLKRILVQIYPLDLQREPIAITTDRVTIGRDANCDLAIPDQSVSRQHAELRLTDQGTVLLDLDSTNGVAVNGARTNAHVLASGDHLQIGTHLFRYLATTDDLEPLLHAAVYSMMTRDGLTRVYNRRFLMETLTREVARCKRHARPLSLVMIAIDDFAAIQARYGPLIGDQVIRQVALRLENVLREDDVLARTNGESFALAMVEATLEHAVDVAERCRLMVGAEPMTTPVGPIRVTISLGITARPESAGRPQEWGSVQDLIEEAKERLGEAMRSGANRLVC